MSTGRRRVVWSTRRPAKRPSSSSSSSSRRRRRRVDFLGDRRGVFRAERRVARGASSDEWSSSDDEGGGGRRARSGRADGTGFTVGFVFELLEDHGFLRAGVGVAPGLTLGAFERLRHLAQFSSTVPRSIL